MTIRYLTNAITRAILGFTLVVSTAVVTNINGQTKDRSNSGENGLQDPKREGYGYYGGSYELRQTALSVGYDEGVKESLNDRDRNRRIDYRTLTTYQEATKGYSARLGNSELYRRYFREAFVRGYNGESGDRGSVDRNDPYGDRAGDNNRKENRRGRNDDGYSNFGGSFQLRRTALNAGFSEGLKQGRNDRKKGVGNGYQKHSTYQNGSKDYSSRLGDRELYRRYFREAYEQGYDDGINGH